MVYRKKYGKKRAYKKKGISLEKRIKKVLFSNSESKYFDKLYSNASVRDTVGNVVSGSRNVFIASDVMEMIQGDSESERIGDSVYVKGIKLKYRLTSSVPTTVRMVILKLPQYQSSIDFTDFNIGILGNYPRSWSHGYKVMKDTVFNIDPDNKSTLTGQMYLPLKCKVTWEDSTTSDPKTNNIVGFLYTDNTTVSVITSDCSTRVFYKDL